MTISSRGFKLYDLPARGYIADRCPAEAIAVEAAYARSGLARRDGIESAVIISAQQDHDTVAVLTHPDDHAEMRARNERFSKYQTFPIHADADLTTAFAAIDRLALMDVRQRRMKRAGMWKTGSRYPARFWMCDTVMRALLDRYGVTPNALQWALGNATGMTVGVEHERIGLKPVKRQGALLLHAPYGVVTKTRKSLPGRLHGFKMEVSGNQVSKFTLKLSETVTFTAGDDRYVEIEGNLLPETLMMSLVGRHISDVVRHELLEVPDAVITRCTWKEGNTRLYLTYGHAFVGDPR